MKRKKSQCSTQCLTRKRWKKANAQFNVKRREKNNDKCNGWSAHCKKKKNLMPKQWTFGQYVTESMEDNQINDTLKHCDSTHDWFIFFVCMKIQNFLFAKYYIQKNKWRNLSMHFGMIWLVFLIFGYKKSLKLTKNKKYNKLNMWWSQMELNWSKFAPKVHKMGCKILGQKIIH